MASRKCADFVSMTRLPLARRVQAFAWRYMAYRRFVALPVCRRGPCPPACTVDRPDRRTERVMLFEKKVVNENGPADGVAERIRRLCSGASDEALS